MPKQVGVNRSKQGRLLLRARQQRISLLVLVSLAPRPMGDLIQQACVVAVCKVSCLVAEEHVTKGSALFVARGRQASLHAVVTLPYTLAAHTTQ